MAALIDTDRVLVMANWMRENNITSGVMTKVDLKAAVNAIDDWVDANTTAFNTAIPQPARGALTTKQKSWLLWHVIRRRFEIS